MPDHTLSSPTMPGRSMPCPAAMLRAVASVVLLTLAAIVVPAALVAGWARLQLVDEDAFAATLAPLATDTRVQSLVIDQTTSAITASLDSSVSDAPIPPAAARASELLGRPTAAVVRSLTERAVTEVVRSDRFSSVWSSVVRTSHRALVFGATSDGGGIVVWTPDGVGIRISGVVEAITDELDLQGSPVAALIPRVDRVVVVSDGAALRLLRSGYAATTGAGVLLSALAVVLLTGGVLVARRRRLASIGAGAAIVGGAGILLVAAMTAPAAVAATVSARGLEPAGAAAIVRQLLSGLVGASGVVLGLGVVVIVAGLLVARSTRSRDSAAASRGGPGSRASITMSPRPAAVRPADRDLGRPSPIREADVKGVPGGPIRPLA